MYNWFEVKATYEKTLENGMQKKVTESYLLDALSFTEAEARAIEELKPYISGEFTIAAVGRKKISELFFNDNGDRFFMAKVAFTTLDEKSGSEKEWKAHWLIGISYLFQKQQSWMCSHIQQKERKVNDGTICIFN